MTEESTGPISTNDKTFFGHPRGLATLFFTELWERFSYYGLRALLILFMTAPLLQKNAGLGFSTRKASAIYGLYTAAVYLLTIAGGWIADNLWGHRRTVFIGGCIIALGHFTMASPLVGIPTLPSFYAGLVCIVLGTGLLKPNVSTMVGSLYPKATKEEMERGENTDWGARRDAGFSIFYMGINIGAILGPTICSYLGEDYNYHWGFSIAGFGMLLGLIAYSIGSHYLGPPGKFLPDISSRELRLRNVKFYGTLGLSAVICAIFAYITISGMVPLGLDAFTKYLGYLILAVTVFYFTYLLTLGGYDADQNKKLFAIFWLFLLSIVFWGGFNQAGSSMNLFAKHLTNRHLGFLGGWVMPAGWLQDINPLFIVLLAPVFGWLWTWLAHRNANPSIPVKFSLGLLGLAAGFFVISWGAAYASRAHTVTPAWLVVTYFFHTVGELCLSPVGLSSITKLAPEDRVGQMMGIWFVGTGLGNLFSGLVAGTMQSLSPHTLFLEVAIFSAGVGVFALILAPLVNKYLMGDVT